MKGAILSLVTAVVLAATAMAQGGAAAPASAVPPSYVIGPNDVLSMSVFGAPELDDPQMQVDVDGTVHTPYGATPVHVAGMTTEQATQAIAAELVHDQLAVKPKVEVRVVQPGSHPVVISGQGVRSPGTIQVIQPIRLLDALTKAGGLSDNSGAVITIIRPLPDGTRQTEVITSTQLLSTPGNADNPGLHGGEEVRVMPGGNVYLSGAVTSPGAYPLNDADPLTVRKLMAKAHGLASAAKADQTQLIHNLGKANQSSTVIDLSDIMNGSKPDVKLAADDMLYVPTSNVKKTAMDVGSRTVSILTWVASQLLVR
jgi:polysaccharide export outer membrane protein